MSTSLQVLDDAPLTLHLLPQVQTQKSALAVFVLPAPPAEPARALYFRLLGSLS